MYLISLEDVESDRDISLNNRPYDDVAVLKLWGARTDLLEMFFLHCEYFLKFLFYVTSS